jgi:hypothetical protein
LGKLTSVAALLVGGVFALPLPSYALTITADYQGPISGMNAVSITLPGGSQVNGGGFLFKQTSTVTQNFVPVTASDDPWFYGWCLQPNETFEDPATWELVGLDVAPLPLDNSPLTPPYYPVAAMGDAGRLDMERLVFRLNPDLDATIGDGTNYGANQQVDLVRQLAFQLAIWEIANENDESTLGYDLSDGTFQFDETGYPAQRGYDTDTWTSAIDQANTWLTSLSGWVDGEVFLMALTNPCATGTPPNCTTFVPKRQDIMVSTGYNESYVPLPAAAWLFGSALLGTVAIARRRKKTA